MKYKCSECDNYADFKVDERYLCRHCYIQAIMRYEDLDAEHMNPLPKSKTYDILMGVK